MDPRLQRLDHNRLALANDLGIEVTVFANEGVPVQSQAVQELLDLLAVQDTVRRVADEVPGYFQEPPSIMRVSVTPDFHKGAGVPVGTVMATSGFVIPKATGNDVNCGMRLHTTSLRSADVVDRLDELETACRHVFFEGGRNIPMTRVQREAMLKEGLLGLLATTERSFAEGLWALFHSLDIEGDLDRVHAGGSLTAKSIFGLQDFLGPEQGVTRGSQIGSIGGGNHFVEFQKVVRILDGQTAYAWGLKEDYVVVMIHTGSVSVGHLCGEYFTDLARRLYPPGLKYPENGIFFLPSGEKYEREMRQYLDSLYNAANFAFTNRLFLGLMALSCLREVCGDTDYGLLYDAPHNLVWEEELDGEPAFLHRKGACPARGFDAMAGTPYAYYGEPVLVPGSMGSSSFILAGLGNPDSLWSASHGAGRSLSRGEALKASEEAFQKFLREFHVVTPLDFRRPDVQQRRDIVEKRLADLKKEAPFAYKNVTPVVETLSSAGIARPVAELRPIMTLKG